MTQTAISETLAANIKRVLTCRASAMFDAILDYTLDNPEPRTNPQITALTITSDGFLMAWHTNSPHKEGLIGAASDVERNILGIAKYVGLNATEAEEILVHAYLKITDWRTSGRRGANPYEQKG